MFWIGLGIGMAIGSTIGMFIVALCVVIREGDDDGNN